VAAAALAIVAARGVSAHRVDEYLQAARISLAADHVEIELDLTPGIALADAIGREIDRDGTGAISSGEGAAYADTVRRALELDIDGTPIAPVLSDSQFPSFEAMRGGEGTVRLRLTAALPGLATGPHELHYRNGHHPDVGVYLANALVPVTSRVVVTAQQRDVDQRELTIAYVLQPAPALSTRLWLLGGVTSMLALALVVRRRRRVRVKRFSLLSFFSQ
jgi:hypothetical protein